MIRRLFAAFCLVGFTNIALAQEPLSPGQPVPGTSSVTPPSVTPPSVTPSTAPPFASMPPLTNTAPPLGSTTVIMQSDPTAATTSYTPGDGLTVKMMNGQSQLKLFGQFSTIGLFSTARPFSAGLPLLMLPPSPFGLNTNTYDLHARQSAFGAAFSGAEVLGFTPGAYFLGFIQNSSLTNDGYGLLPYQAYGDLKNEHWRIAAGLQTDVFNPQSPTIISLSKLYGSGNTGSFRGQFRVENYIKPSDSLQFTTQVALSEPVSSVVMNNSNILEDNGWPNVEARFATGIGAIEELAGGRKQRRIELGVSGVVGQLRTSRLITSQNQSDLPNRTVVNTWGLGIDGQVAITDRIGVAGELFTGQAIGEYNGAIQQSYNSNFGVIRSQGGWGEVYCYFTDAVHLHTGYGIDDPRRQDLSATQFARNQTYFANLVWDVSKVLQLSFEVDYRKTDYIAFPNAHGVLFYTQMLMRF